MSDAGSKNPKEAARADAKAAKATKRREVNAGTSVAIGEHAREAGYVPRFKKRYNEVIKAELMKKFGYTNAMQVPKLNKVVLNIGAGEAASDGKKITQAVNDLTAIAGQKAVQTRAKKAIATFKIRKDLPTPWRFRAYATSAASIPSRSTDAATMPWA
jgi:large subunit ribosomal protein L5